MMKKILALMLMLALAAAAPVLAQEEGVIVQSSCSIVQSGDYYMTYCFAQVHNNTDQVLCLEDGMFYLSDGEEIIAQEEVSKLWPYFLAPGEDGYLFDIIPFETMPQITGLEYSLQYLLVNPAYAGVKLDAQTRVELDEDSGVLSVVCELTNPTDVEAFDPSLAIGLYTDAGQLVYAEGRNLSDVGMAAQGKLLVRFEVEPDMVAQWIGYDALPTQVQVNAMFRTGSD